MKKGMSIFAIMGMLYVFMENVFTAFWSLITTGSLALRGFSSLWMWLVGGLLGLTLGLFNRFNWIRKNCNVFSQSLAGSVLITTVEFISGVILNILCGFGLWSYYGLPLNILGQVCVPFMVLWFLICPLAFWVDDVLRYFLYKEGRVYSLLAIYKDLFLFWKTTAYQAIL